MMTFDQWNYSDSGSSRGSSCKSSSSSSSEENDTEDCLSSSGEESNTEEDEEHLVVYGDNVEEMFDYEVNTIMGEQELDGYFEEGGVQMWLNEQFTGLNEENVFKSSETFSFP